LNSPKKCIVFHLTHPLCHPPSQVTTEFLISDIGNTAVTGDGEWHEGWLVETLYVSLGNSRSNDKNLEFDLNMLGLVKSWRWGWIWSGGGGIVVEGKRVCGDWGNGTTIARRKRVWLVQLSNDSVFWSWQLWCLWYWS
jgi:hypothetical protein